MKFDRKYYKEFGKRLKRARALKGVKSIWVANQMGVLPAQLSAWEKGRHRMPIDLLQPACEILDVDLNYLVIGE